MEQEQADIEYKIRLLMAQPECNKTDSDKAREESLITRLVEVSFRNEIKKYIFSLKHCIICVQIVQLRNEVIDCLEMDRLRENEEDLVRNHSRNGNNSHS